jgi:hypothetical protein
MAKHKIRLEQPKDKRRRTGILPEVVDHLHRTWTVVVHDEPHVHLDQTNLTAYVPQHVGEELDEDGYVSDATALAARAEKFHLLTRIRTSPPDHPDWARRVVRDQSLIDEMEHSRTRQIAMRVAADNSEYQLADKLEEHRAMSSEERDAIRSAWLKGDLRTAARLAMRHDGWAPYRFSEAVNDASTMSTIASKSGMSEGDVNAEFMDIYRLLESMDRDDSKGYRDSVLKARLIEDLPTVRTPGRRPGPKNPDGGDLDPDASSWEELVEKSHGTPEDRYTPKPKGDDRLKKAQEALNEAMRAAGAGQTGEEGEGDPNAVPFEGDSDDVDLDPESLSMDDFDWGDVEWEKPPLVRNLLLGKVARKARPTDEGAVIRHMSRWYTDRRIFTRKRKLPGGTLLIDQSGSMSLTPAQVDEIIDAAPHATIVGYCGMGTTGTMRLLASKGKRVGNDDVKIPGAGNVIDGPALKWLAKQEEPRVWVSDGLVVPVSDRVKGVKQDGRRDAMALAIVACRNFAKKHKIVRMRDADEAVRLLRMVK